MRKYIDVRVEHWQETGDMSIVSISRIWRASMFVRLHPPQLGSKEMTSPCTNSKLDSFKGCVLDITLYSV